MATLHMLKSVQDTINTSFILKDEDTLLVFDGGFPCEANYLHDYLLELGGTVNGWFLTHIHDDHIGAMLNVLNHYTDIHVEKVFCNFPSDEFIETYEPRQTTMTSIELSRLFHHTLSRLNIPLIRVNEQDTISFNKIAIRVLLTPDESITCGAINNSSCVFSVTVEGKRILFLGDLGPEGGARLLQRVEPDLLKSDYVQMSHHGQGGVNRDVYEIIRPDYCFWCTPTWLWDNSDGTAAGYDTGKFKTIVTRGWISELGCVKRHYVMKDGTHVIDL